ncbi:hypothetical protein EQG49_02295 [Periweissella cryptocerci]|uniref:Uncharacterized protein n=1 Tax=Periweissella cryptocerci TaxID=2506420 RepID=A0A4P6YRT1_9LACO|nr:DUF6096 family protein [Periweissella cryptocerci]QBO35377.1 hypothetical protein EQG49_02295 [Periweissella cryptocerci]
MKPIEFKFGSKTLSLKLDTATAVRIETRLGKAFVGIFFDGENFRLPMTQELLIVLQEANTIHGVAIADMYALNDEFMAAGGNYMELIPAIQNLMSEAGFLPKTDKPEAIKAPSAPAMVAVPEVQVPTETPAQPTV